MDSLQGVGPFRCAVVSDAGPSPGTGNSTKEQQVVGGTGYGKSGSLAILQRSLLPETVTEVPLSGDLQQPILLSTACLNMIKYM